MNSSKYEVCILGLGYIGLPTAALLANRGINVLGVDVQKNVVDTLNQGKIHILEPDLDTFVNAAVGSGKLKASLVPDTAEYFIIAVPTPFYASKSINDIPKPNLEYVFSAVDSILPFLKDGDSIVLESTSPVGTTVAIEKYVNEKNKKKLKLNFAHCPERVLPGHIMRELVENDRIIGGTNLESTKKIAQFYRKFVKGEVLETTANTAEMAKLTENSFRDVNIAFANEISLLCEKFRINVWELISLANRHPRVNILNPGCGVGGHCIAVDPWFLVSADPDHSKLIKSARDVNNYKQKWVVEQVQKTANQFVQTHGRAPLIVCYGVSFKPNVDDLRESPALEIYYELNDLGFHVKVVEPNISAAKNVELISLENALLSADIHLVLVKHKEFIQSMFIQKEFILDYCGVLDVTSRY